MTREELSKAIREDYERKGVWACKSNTINMQLNFEMLGIILEALEQEPREITLEDVKEYCKPRCLTIITDELLYELTHPKIKALEQEWILTSERPPEIDDEVIAYDGADAFVAWYGVNGWHSTDNRFDPRTPIIKWKPINLPKAEEKTNDSCWKEYYESKFMKKV